MSNNYTKKDILSNTKQYLEGNLVRNNHNNFSEYMAKINQYKDMFESLKEAIIIHKDKEVIYLNSEALELIGKDNIKHLNINCIYEEENKEYSPEIQNIYIESTHKSQIKTIAHESIKSYKSDFVNIEYKSVPIILTDEKYIMSFIKVLSKNHNINEENRNEENYREIFKQTLNAVAIYETKDFGESYTIKDINKSALNLIKLKREQVIGKKLTEVFPNIYKNEFYSILKEVYTNGKGQVTPITFYKDERINLWKENYLFKSSTGDIVSIFRDREDMMLLNKKLNKFKILYENSKDIILFISEDGNIIDVNEAAINEYGYSKEELLSMNIAQLRADSTLEQINKQISKAYSKGIFFETMHKNKEGKEFPVQVSSIGTSIDGNPVVCSIIRDLSYIKNVEHALKNNRKRLDEIKELERLRTEFISNLSHEFRTPLNIILGSQQLLSLYLSNYNEESLNIDKINSSLDAMKKNSYRLMRMLNNLLDISKIDSGLYELNIHKYNIVNLVESVSLATSEFVNNRGVELLFDTEIEECVVSCDSHEMERILLNLISNAIKFTKPGDKIFVNMYEKEDKVRIVVKDTGVGIPKEDLDSIFDRFGQVDKSFTRIHEGIGVGLSIIKSLVNLQGGRISVNSKTGEGSEFIIELPVEKYIDIDEIAIDGCYEKIVRMQEEFSDIYDYV